MFRSSVTTWDKEGWKHTAFESVWFCDLCLTNHLWIKLAKLSQVVDCVFPFSVSQLNFWIDYFNPLLSNSFLCSTVWLWYWINVKLLNRKKKTGIFLKQRRNLLLALTTAKWLSCTELPLTTLWTNKVYMRPPWAPCWAQPRFFFRLYNL